jgi:diketogulonate reductase-like aldo/keto reductase
MAYTPLGTGTMLGNPTLAQISRQHGATPAQVALAWLLRQENIIVIPKASRLEHVRENHGARDLKLADEDLTALDRAFPSPKGRSPLDML